VLAFSSGNHAIAVAQAAAAFHVPATIVMPADAPAAKRETAAAAGAELVLYDRLTESREAIAAALAQERSLPVVPPFDDPFVMAGQGTAGLEIAADLGARGERIDLALICASGGGLASGVGVALKAFDPAIDVVVVEPDGHDDIARSLSSGAIVRNAPGVRSICDGLLVEQMGAHPFATLRALEARTVTVTDAEVRRAMRLAFETLKLVLEPSGAAALAAALAGKADVAGRNVVVLASGGNVDPAVFAAVLQH
jgi:threonine dehydratase